MATKKRKKAVKRARKPLTGLKKYVILALIAVVGISLIIFYLAWNSAIQNVADSDYGVVNLPETGEVVYYSNCMITAPEGLGNYENGSEVKCTFRGPTDSGYDFETSQMYLQCEINEVIEKNTCSSGVAK